MSLVGRAFYAGARAAARVVAEATSWYTPGGSGTGYGRHGGSWIKKSLAGWLTWPGGPEADITLNLGALRERSRDLYMGEPLAGGALKTIRTNEIGAGLRLNAQIDAKFLGLTDEQALEWEERVEREFALWADTTSCDIERRNTFGELQALARLSQLMSGDVFALVPSVARVGERYDLRVQLIEADRISDPNPKDLTKDILGGVEVDEHGAPVAYYIQDPHPGDRVVGDLRLVQMPTWTRVPAFGEVTGRRLVLHLMESERPGQRRGVPLLAPVIEHLKQLSRYSQAELTAAVVSGFFTAAITSETPATPLSTAIPPGQQVKEAVADENSYQLAPGAILGLAPGEKIETVNPGRPNAGFDPFVIAICRQIGAGIGLPYEILIQHFTSSYSASRAALLEAWKRFTVGRRWMVLNFCQPVYEAWLAEAVARGYIQAPGFFGGDPLVRQAWCGAEWNGPTQGQLDPVKEVDAAARRVEEGFSTRTRETAELTGGNFERFNRVREREERVRRAAGLASEANTNKSTKTAPAVEEAA